MGRYKELNSETKKEDSEKKNRNHLLLFSHWYLEEVQQLDT
jgi:hypothetical protein